MDRLQRELGGGDDYFEQLEPQDLDEEEIQVLSPRRKVLVDLERILGVEIPATRKTHQGRDWKKASPNIANQDLYAILRGVCQKLGVAPQAARTIRPDILELPEGQARVYYVLDEEPGYMSVEEIAEQTDMTEGGVRKTLQRMKQKIDFHIEREGMHRGFYRKLYGLPPAFQDLDVRK
jgi:biotin operon repressor